jgi:putative membrane protein
MMGYGFGAGMMGYGGYGFGFLWQILWLVIIVAVIYALINSGKNKDERSESSLEILKERLARGEIDYEEYVRIREGLKR